MLQICLLLVTLIVATGGRQDQIVDWFHALPFITRYWFGGTLLFSILAAFEILPRDKLTLDPYLTFREFEIWRPFTALLYYPTDCLNVFSFTYNCSLLVTFSTILERDVFRGHPADYAFLLLCAWLTCQFVDIFVTLRNLMRPMVYILLFLWCALNPATIITFVFGLKIRAEILPWAKFAFSLLINQQCASELLAIFITHSYYFLKYQYPEIYGSTIIHTPHILTTIFPPNPKSENYW